MPETFARRGRTFEAFEIGDTFISDGRTVTEADIVAFAGVSGDFTQLHTNVRVAQEGPYGERIAHGLLALSIASGLLAQLGFVEGTVLAFREMRWKFSHPVAIGDTIRVEARVVDVRALRRLGGGAVTLRVQVFDQDNRVVQHGDWKLLIASGPAPDA